MKKDVKEAVRLYVKAAERSEVEAMLVLAGMYLAGVEVDRDEKEYVKWMRKATNKGSAQAMAGLGLAYELGQGGLARDRTKALEWYKKAAALGDPVAKRAVERLEK